MICCRSLHEDLTSQLEEFKQHLEHNAREIPELKAWQLQGSLFSQYMCIIVICISLCMKDLGFQAAQRVVSSSSDMALSVIRDLSQNLPSMARYNMYIIDYIHIYVS